MDSDKKNQPPYSQQRWHTRNICEYGGKRRTHMRLGEFMSLNSGGLYHTWSRVISTFALAVMTSALIGCSMGYGDLEVPDNRQPRAKRPTQDMTNRQGGNLLTGISPLIDNQVEETGYGLYSYVLFESPPTDEDKPIYLAVISACLKKYPDLGGLAKKYRPESLNALHIPVTRNIVESEAEEFLKRYNYGRARVLLNRLSKIKRNGGPYVVSSLAPLSHSNETNPFLYQDLSAVRFVSGQDSQTRMASTWVHDFISGVSSPRGWDQATLGRFGKEMRDTRQSAFESYGVSADKLDLKRYIVFPMDTNAERMLPFPTWKIMVSGSSPNPIMLLDQS